MEIFKLFGSILINSDEADKSLAKTGKNAEGLGSKLTKGIGIATKFGVGLAVAATTGATALLGLAVKASATAAAIDDVAQRTNLSAKTLQEFKYAAEESGFSLDTIEGAAKKLTMTMGKYADGNKATVSAFEELGISAVGTNGKLKSTDELFPQIIAKLASMEDITERNALAMEIFGKSAMDMAPLLNEGEKGVTALQEEAHKLGLVMSDESVKAGALFDDTMVKVKLSLGAVVTKIGLEVMPTIQKMLDWIILHMPEIQAIAGKAFDTIAKSIQWVMDNSNWLIPVLGGLVGAFAALKVIEGINVLIGIFNFLLTANPIGIVIIALAALGLGIAAIVTHWKDICEWVQKAWDKLNIWNKTPMSNKSAKVTTTQVTEYKHTGTTTGGLDLSKYGTTYGGGSAFAVGSRYIPYDMNATVHEGEMIVPKSENPYANSGGNVIPKSNQPIIIITQLDGREIARTIVDPMSEELERKRKSSSLAYGGVF